MSSEIDRKRQRSDDEDEDMYNPSVGELPPHMMQDNAANDDGYAPPPHEMHQHQQQQQQRRPELPRGPRQDRGPRGGSGYDQHYAKRGRRETQLSYELEKANELMKNLQRLGENPYTLDNDFMAHAGAIAYFWQEELFKVNVLKFIGASIVEFPHKLLQFSVIITLANARNPEVGKSFIGWVKERIEEVFIEKIEENEMDVDIESAKEPEMININGWNRVKLLFRTLAVLSSIIEDFDSVIQLAEDALKLAISLQSKANGVRSPLGEMIFFEFTISIPYILANHRADTELKEKCRTLLETAKQFKTTETTDLSSSPFIQGLTPFSEILSKVAGIVESTIDDVSLFTDFSRILNGGSRSMLEQKAEEDLVISGNATAESQPIVGEAERHTLGRIQLPNVEELTDDLSKSKSNVDKLWSSPRFIIQIFKNESVRSTLDFDTLPPIDSYTSLITRDLVEDLVLNVEYNRVTVSRQLFSLSSYFNSRLFALPFSSLEKLMIINDLNKSDGKSDLIANLEANTEFPDHVKGPMIESARNIIRDYDEGFKSTWKMDEVYLETIVNLMFKLPDVDLPMVYFQSLLMATSGRDWEIAKHESNESEPLTFSKLLGDSFRYFYTNADNLKHETFAKFVNWFVYQISNFKFEWEWQEWVPDILHIGAENLFDKKVSFIRNAIHKEILITSYKLIKNKTLPDDFKHFASLAVNNKSALEKYDAQFFGETFAQTNTQDPAMEDPRDAVFNNGDEMDRIIETNTDAFKLFNQYFFNHHEHIYHDICRDVYMNLENMESSVEDFMSVIDRLRESIESTPDEQRVIKNVDQYIVTLVVQSICLIGSRSFSVLQDGLQNLFGGKVKAIMDSITNPDKPEWVSKSVLRLWVNEPRIGMLFLSKLINYGIEPIDIINGSWLYVSDGNPVPVQELWMEQFLDRYILDEDMSQERQTLLNAYFTNAALFARGAAAEANGDITGSTPFVEFIRCKYNQFTTVDGVDAAALKEIVGDYL